MLILQGSKRVLMAGQPDRRDPRSDDVDPFGMDEADQSFWARSFGLVLPGRPESILPKGVAKRGLSVSVTTDRDTIRVGDSVEITIVIANRLPVSISVPIDGKQQWGWTIDGHEAARDEPGYRSGGRTELRLEGRERRTHTRRWDGRIKRSGDPPEWVDADPGRYEIRAYIPVAGGSISDATEIRVR